MALHLARIAALTLLGVACLFLPYLPGGYDPLAAPVSAMAQMLGLAGVILVPMGATWLIYEVRTRGRRGAALPGRDWGFVFALLSLAAATLVMAFEAIVAFALSGVTLGIIVVALWLYVVIRLAPALKRLKRGEIRGFSMAPLYLVVIPAALFLCQHFLLAPAADRSRRLAVQSSEPLIADIEAYRRTHGEYPLSLLSEWEDYKTGVIGVERYLYEPQGDAYNLVFEHPSTAFGTREFVVYNPLDEQTFTSHDMDLLQMSLEDLNRQRGFHAVHDGPAEHWKRFLFD